MNETGEYRTSVHEAAHATVAHRRGIPFSSVELTPRSRETAGAMILSEAGFKATESAGGLLDLIAVIGAGPVATVRCGGAWPDDDDPDVRAIATCRRLLAKKAPAVPLPRLFAAAEWELDQPGVWSAVLTLAAELRRRGRLNGVEAVGLLTVYFHLGWSLARRRTRPNTVNGASPQTLPRRGADVELTINDESPRTLLAKVRAAGSAGLPIARFPAWAVRALMNERAIVVSNGIARATGRPAARGAPAGLPAIRAVPSNLIMT